MSRLINKRRNIYLVAGLFLSILFSVLMFFEVVNVDRQLFDSVTSKKTLIISLIYITIFAPIIEEIAFRLNINTKNKWFIVVSFLVASGIIFLSFEIVLSSILFLAFVFSILFYFKSKKSYALDIQIIVTSIIFSLMHFSGDITTAINFLSLSLYFLYFVGAGLILAWLRINYKFYSNVIAHILINSIATIVTIFPSFDSETKTIDCDELQFFYSERHIFNNEGSSAFLKQDTLVLKNTNIIYMLDLYLKDEDVKSKYIQTNGLIFYDLKLPEFYDTSPQAFLDCLEEHELIKRKSSVQVDLDVL
ncbi:CPBP family intramembrane glutamic endopeptidase [Psychroflexus sediminis]|uniref:CAAX protease self-immunity n=1 Tax=Psychroflexus sediminis TaxID=470826 RepID=A0A1G7WPK9_9FLAO|nr:CPBP family intramembrane glutamic endopeptidase [Psychroflexus sediminis]SDG73808.1 CAAX protease self-immunity [Psychroflexus sediminis]